MAILFQHNMDKLSALGSFDGTFQKKTNNPNFMNGSQQLAVLIALKLLSLKLQTLAVLMALFSKVGLLVNKLPTFVVLMALLSKSKKYL